MDEFFKQVITSQYQAALGTLEICLNRWPAGDWNEPISSMSFDQAIFHTLFFADVYLSQNLEDFKQQPFHLENADSFQDYEELIDRRRQYNYERPFIERYLEFCFNKAEQVLASETENSLAAEADFSWQAISRAELHLYNIRHLQHHAAQLILKMRLAGQENIPWVKSGRPKLDA